MTEQDILTLIHNDTWMMHILRTAEKLQLPDWVIGAGFVRNKVWDQLHGFTKNEVETNDIDLVYFDPNGNDQQADEALSQTLQHETGIPWEIVNEVYAHAWNDLPPYTSTEDAISTWPETATCIGVTIEDGALKLIAPHGIEDLVQLIVRPSPTFSPGITLVQKRAAEKRWMEKWPKLRFSSDAVAT